MKFIIEREKIIKPLQQISSPLNNRPIQPVLRNILIEINDQFLVLTGTDLEIEIVTKVALIKSNLSGSVTIPARKFLEICKNLPQGSIINVSFKNDRMLINCGNSRFSLSTLPAKHFPNLDTWNIKVEFNLFQDKLKQLIETTEFSMANQDVRYYLNGIMFEIADQEIRAVATDGHRLATSFVKLNEELPHLSIIIPRKGIIELLRLLNGENISLKIQMGLNNIRIYTKEIIFTSRLIDGCFPDYRQILHQDVKNTLEIDCVLLKQALSRAAILSNETFRGIRLQISKNQLIITANNPDYEESEEKLEVIYNGDILEICFNVVYILDILNVIKYGQISLSFMNSTSSVYIKDIKNPYACYIVMPMRI
ncbi:DNA polymerase III subunit beta [Candidatus Pantoea edessiphila]|uniref:Beta sliding clamp n=1 Tax=Candidatus Pantoea edessiphila TaxID=2044610 RepID=A0A2P5SZ94_9GAMM|nr:DNA polymerase III subunit beta [Candidatus Pantoea edessiphila]PPI87654.1 DNA polymerase III subunit beta [Candidatus Pantoea edessiphila]